MHLDYSVLVGLGGVQMASVCRRRVCADHKCEQPVPKATGVQRAHREPPSGGSHHANVLLELPYGRLQGRLPA